MTTDRQQLGRAGECLAAGALQQAGYRILARNYRNRLGEIDIIAKDGDTLVFAEVKSRRSNRFGSPKLAVTTAKQRKMSRTALLYLKACGQTAVKARFDVIAVDTTGPAPRVEVVKNAFDLQPG
jgi:putative endonuclease